MLEIANIRTIIQNDATITDDQLERWMVNTQKWMDEMSKLRRDTIYYIKTGKVR